MNEKRWKMKKKLTVLLFVIIASISLAGCGRRFPGEYTYELANAIARELRIDGKAEYEEGNKKEFYTKPKDKLSKVEWLLQENAKKDKIIRCLLIGQVGLAVVLIVNEIAQTMFKGVDGSCEKDR